MALLTDNIAPKSNASTLMSQFSRDMQQYRAAQERKAEREELKENKRAETRGTLSAGVGALSAFPGLQSVSQGMYDTYVDLESKGDVEGAAMVKSQLTKQLDAFNGYAQNHLDQRRKLNDPDAQSQFVTPYSDLQSIADEWQGKDYNYIGFIDGNHIVEDEDGNQINVNQIPGVADGSDFLTDERVIVKEDVPAGYKDVYTIASSMGGQLLTTDVVDDYGRITNPEALRESLDSRVEDYMNMNEGQLMNMVYLDQLSKGTMDRYDQEKVLMKMQDSQYVEELKKQFKNDAYNQIVASVDPQDTPAQKTAKESAAFVEDITVTDGKLVFADEPLRFDIVSTDGDKEVPKAMYVLGIEKDERGLPVLKNSVLKQLQGGVTEKSTENIPLKPGTPEWNGLVDEFGGEKYLKRALKKAGIDLDFYEM